MIKNTNISLNQTVSKVKGNIVSDMSGEKVMLSVKNGKYYSLGDIGGEIWDLIEGGISVNQLITSIMSTYEVDRAKCEKQVVSFLEHLLDESLIEISNS